MTLQLMLSMLPMQNVASRLIICTGLVSVCNSRRALDCLLFTPHTCAYRYVFYFSSIQDSGFCFHTHTDIHTHMHTPRNTHLYTHLLICSCYNSMRHLEYLFPLFVRGENQPHLAILFLGQRYVGVWVCALACLCQNRCCTKHLTLPRRDFI